MVKKSTNISEAGMIPFEQALSLIWRFTDPLGSESILASQALGRVLAEKIRASGPLPPFPKSAMDGYALDLTGKEKYPLTVKVAGLVKAGDQLAKVRKSSRSACKIMTGAPVPAGLNTVVCLEDVEELAGGQIRISKKIKIGANICLRGQDVKKGATVMPAGIYLREVEIGILASLGIRQVEVVRQPRIAILTTGDELVEPAMEPLIGQIRDTNRPLLKAYFEALGLKVLDMGIARDNRRSLSEKINQGLKADILIISGGVSRGDYDLVPQMLAKTGVRQVFHNVFVKPGKPLFFGKTDSTLVFGLPGNPVSSLLGARLYVQTALEKMSTILPLARFPGLELLGFQEGKLAVDVHKKKGRLSFLPVWAEPGADGYRLTPVKYNGSADLTALAGANGFMKLEGEREAYVEESSVAFFLV